MRRDEIAQHIVERDPVFRDVVAVVGLPPARRPAPSADRFAAVIRTVTYQLLAGRAASTIHARVEAVCDHLVTPERLLAIGPTTLQGAGLNAGKANAMVGLAQAVVDGNIDFTRHGRRSDTDVVRELTAVKGVGPWTVQMYLMNTLGRRDVWPIGDYGVRSGWSLLHGLDDTIAEKDLRVEGERFEGLRSDVAWYCWRAIDIARASK